MDNGDSLKSLGRDLRSVAKALAGGRSADRIAKFAHQVVRNRLRSLVLHDDYDRVPTTGFAHYTSWNVTRNMWQQDGPVLRMYDYETSADPLEGKIVPEMWNDVMKSRQWLVDYRRERIDGKNSKGTYGCSFSTKDVGDVEDQLMYWMLYGNNGNGTSLFIPRLPSVCGYPMYRVRYRKEDGSAVSESDKEEDASIARQLANLVAAADEAIAQAPSRYRSELKSLFAEALIQIVKGFRHTIKHQAYEHEREWRMIAVQPKAGDVKFDVYLAQGTRRYVEGCRLKDLLQSQSKIVIGPTVANGESARDFVIATAKRQGIDGVEVKRSECRYR